MAKKKNSFASRMNKTLTTIKSPTFKMGFANIDIWLDMGNFAMNRLWSGRFDRALLFGRNYIFYGESGSGKSLMAAKAAADAQKAHGAYVVWMDVEHASDDEAGRLWLQRAGIDTGEESFQYLSLSTLEEIKKTVAKVSIDYQKAMDDGEEDLPPIVFVVDSWAAALTESQWDKTGGKEAGKVVGDMGQKAKQTGDVINSITHLCAGKPIMVIGVQHIMDNQDGYGRKHKTTGGNKMIFYASGCMMLSKKELKEEEVEDATVTEHYSDLDAGMSAEARKKIGKSRFVGITATMEILKSRVSKPFDKVELQIPYITGLDPYAGLFHLLQQEGEITTKASGWYQYNDGDEVIKFRKKEFREHADRIMELASFDISKPEPTIALDENIDDSESVPDVLTAD